MKHLKDSECKENICKETTFSRRGVFCSDRHSDLILPSSKKQNKISHFAALWVSSPGSGLLLPLPLCQARCCRHKLGWERLATTCQWLNEDRVMRSCGGGFGPVPPVEWINVSFIPHLAPPTASNKGRGDLQFPGT